MCLSYSHVRLRTARKSAYYLTGYTVHTNAYGAPRRRRLSRDDLRARGFGRCARAPIETRMVAFASLYRLIDRRRDIRRLRKHPGPAARRRQPFECERGMGRRGRIVFRCDPECGADRTEPR